ncbi:DNA translocase FtsK [Oceanobacillus saliphilus]|uniref:DNA translocase FtsK n=1 Tax=Oceanobacillus saliphilus TaxID=2925834 RepID=UPI00201E5D75|nr:DNA translocase FtsK [Oceanobacillus saliphilus]
MWNQWKKKIKNIFTEEVEVEVKEVVELRPQKQQNNGKQSLKAKMIYQYPDRNSFRFPVIPDEPQRKQAEAFPAYEKKRNRPTERSERKTKEDRPKQVKRTYREASIENRKIYKKDPSVPFQLSDVPSPVYGYQKKDQKKEIENIPAFKRKELKEENISEKIQVIEPVADEKELKKNDDGTFILDRKSEAAQAVGSKGNEKSTNVIELIDNKETAATLEQPERKTVSESAPREQSSKRKINPISTTDNRRSYEKKTNESSSEPFNVIMTPRDKKKLFDRQQEQRKLEKRIQNLSSYPSNADSNKREETHKQVQHEDPNQVELHARAEQQREEQFSKQAAQIRKDYQQSKWGQSVSTEQIESEPVQEVQQIHVPYHLLNDPIEKNNDDQLWVDEQQRLLEQTLKYFNVRAKVVKATQGPSVTRFEVQPEMGVKVSKIKNLSDDLKLNMSAKDIRIEAPIPGKNTVGIEIPNQKAEMVGLQSIFETGDFKDSESPLSIALGLTIEGYPKITNIQKMPHGLIAGATGSGKSVCINTILISLIYKASHEDVKFLLIDPKMVELAPYNGIPHLVAPVITDVKAATQSLKWAVNEMEDRYEKFVEEGVRDIERYNQKVIKQGRSNQKMPFIVIVIDELADLMMMSPQDVEDSISRIAQKARACGIHLLLATQRPSVDVITGLIKANIPTRIAFSVSSQIDSRTIIDSSGAEKLLGKGDMLFVENGAGKSVRLQGPFVSDEEIERVTNYARSIAEPNYLFEQEQLLEQISVDEDEDDLMEQVIQFVLNQRSASTSLLQRHFKIGYNRAARLIDTLESRGYISGQNGSKAREVLITPSQLEEM